MTDLILIYAASVLAGATLALTPRLIRALQDVRATRRRRDRLGWRRDHLDESDLGEAALVEARLRGSGAVVEGPDGAPALIATLHAGGDVRTQAAEGLTLELTDGARVVLAGPVVVDVGGRRLSRRKWSALPARWRSRVAKQFGGDHPPETLRLEWMREGARVLVHGRLAVGFVDGIDGYRDRATRWELEPTEADLSLVAGARPRRPVLARELFSSTLAGLVVAALSVQILASSKAYSAHGRGILALRRCDPAGAEMLAHAERLDAHAGLFRSGRPLGVDSREASALLGMAEGCETLREAETITLP